VAESCIPGDTAQKDKLKLVKTLKGMLDVIIEQDVNYAQYSVLGIQTQGNVFNVEMNSNFYCVLGTDIWIYQLERPFKELYIFNTLTHFDIPKTCFPQNRISKVLEAACYMLCIKVTIFKNYMY
jgi:hypothetical protein